MDRKSISSNIRKIRLSLGKTQEEMADMMDIGRGTYVNLESGRTALVSDHIYRIAEIAGVTAEQVLFGLDVTGSYLNECADFEEMKRALREQYEKELAEKDAEIRNLNNIMEAQNKTIASDLEAINSLKQMNNFLHSRLEQLESEKRY